MEEELVYAKKAIRRNRMYNEPILRLNIEKGDFKISYKVFEAMQITDDPSVMFGFNQNGGKAYMEKYKEDDRFKFSKEDKLKYRLTSKELSRFFIKTFKLNDMEGSIFTFNVDLVPDSRGMHNISLVSNS